MKTATRVERHLSNLVWTTIRARSLNVKHVYTSPGIHVSESIAKVLAETVTKCNVHINRRTICYADVLHDTSFTEIQAEMPEGRAFTNTSTFFTQLAILLRAQRGGTCLEYDPLLVNGCMNLFYVEIRKVESLIAVRFDRDFFRWDIQLYYPDELCLHKAHRVFSASLHR